MNALRTPRKWHALKAARPQWALCLAVMCMGTTAMALTAQEEKTAKAQIKQEYQAAKKACKSLAGNAKDVCEAEAEGREKIAKAELNVRKKDTPEHRADLAKVRADAQYEIDKEKCDDLKGNAEDVCEKDAKAAHVRALEAAKVSEVRAQPAGDHQKKAADVAEARKDASEHVRKADYEAAKERCDALAGDAKDVCVNDAKRKYAQ